MNAKNRFRCNLHYVDKREVWMDVNVLSWQPHLQQECFPVYFITVKYVERYLIRQVFLGFMEKCFNFRLIGDIALDSMSKLWSYAQFYFNIRCLLGIF